MKEQINEADVTIEVHGFFYKIPYFVMLEDPAITDYFKVDKDSDGESMIKRYFLHPALLKERNSLFILKAIVALKKNEYYSYRYVKLNEFDDVREAMMAYVKQFDDNNHLDYLKRELSFFAGAEWRQFRKDDPFVILFDALRTFFGGIPETLTVGVPGNFWPCSNHVVENMRKVSGSKDAVVATDPLQPQEGSTVHPVGKFIFGPLTIYIKDKVL